MDARQQQVLLGHKVEVLAVQPRLAALERRLLALGGEALVFRPEPDLDLLLARGRPFAGRARQVAGGPSDCHGNAARLWRQTRPHTRLVTGWALSADGLWRQHSWLLRGHGLIETTERRTRYFGVVLSDTEADAFAHAN